MNITVIPILLFFFSLSLSFQRFALDFCLLILSSSSRTCYLDKIILLDFPLEIQLLTSNLYSHLTSVLTLIIEQRSSWFHATTAIKCY